MEVTVIMEDDNIGLTAIVGEEGTGKTSMAVSFPRKVIHFDIDVGGFKRVAWRIPDDVKIIVLGSNDKFEDVKPADFDILSKAYPKEILNVDKLLGQKAVGDITSRGFKVELPKKVVGMRELWHKFVYDFVVAAQWPEVNTMILDSATLLWNIVHKCHLQELQEKQVYAWNKEHANTPFNENEYRERLQPIEYGPANDKMREVFQTARAFNKNLVLTHYPTDVYGPMPDGHGGMEDKKTGQVTLDGFKETAKLMDVVVWTSIQTSTRDKKGGGKETYKFPVATFHKAGIAGMGINAVGEEINATYEAILSLRNLMRMSQ